MNAVSLEYTAVALLLPMMGGNSSGVPESLSVLAEEV